MGKYYDWSRVNVARARAEMVKDREALANSRNQALSNLLEARCPSGELFTEIHGEDEWAEMSVNARFNIVDGAYYDVSSELYDAEAELDAVEKWETDTRLKEELLAKMNNIVVSELRVRGFKEKKGKEYPYEDEIPAYQYCYGGPSDTESTYIWVYSESEIYKLRVSDHAPVSGGGWSEEKQQRYGDSDFSFHPGISEKRLAEWLDSL